MVFELPTSDEPPHLPVQPRGQETREARCGPCGYCCCHYQRPGAGPWSEIGGGPGRDYDCGTGDWSSAASRGSWFETWSDASKTGGRGSLNETLICDAWRTWKSSQIEYFSTVRNKSLSSESTLLVDVPSGRLANVAAFLGHDRSQLRRTIVLVTVWSRV